HCERTAGLEGVANRETRDLSLAMTLILAAGLGLWVVYGVLKSDPVIVVANAIAMLLALTLAGLKLRHG
ncbi:MAG: hypothetical protein HC807_02570, partial [Gammaproteobacteria bacterium]|nr:hypothetical protein [Gammaproteobacteria bacterium]